MLGALGSFIKEVEFGHLVTEQQELRLRVGRVSVEGVTAKLESRTFNNKHVVTY